MVSERQMIFQLPGMPENKALRILIFPIDLDESKQFASFARSLGSFVLGASSVLIRRDTIVDEFAYLPYVTEKEFDASFEQLVKQHSITHVYTPHSAIWWHVDRLIKANKYSFHLCTPSPFEADWEKYEQSYLWTDIACQEKFVDYLDDNVKVQNQLPKSQYAGLHKQFIQIPGQCGDDKLLSLVSIFRIVPKGDVVEIGSLYGRSAYALAWLAEKFSVGNVISIDPWDIEKTEAQGGEANKFLNPGESQIDVGKIFKIFLATASIQKNMGYIKERSEDAVHTYTRASSEGKLVHQDFGELVIKGEIALLHIDGNHKYEHVQRDIELWCPLLVSGGWLLLDDYVWAFGDGPQKAGDQLLERGGFDIAFCLGDTLYLRKQ